VHVTVSPGDRQLQAGRQSTFDGIEGPTPHPKDQKDNQVFAGWRAPVLGRVLGILFRSDSNGLYARAFIRIEP
jgi:hypothetical protein